MSPARINRGDFAAAHHRGMNRNDLAAHFNVSPDTVTRISRELRLPLDNTRRKPTRTPKVDREEVKRLVEGGWSNRNIAQRFDCHIDTITRIRTELGISHAYKGRPLTEERKQVIRQMLDDGWSHAEISRTEGADVETLTRHFPGTAWTKQQQAEHVSALRTLNPHFNRPPKAYDRTIRTAA